MPDPKPHVDTTGLDQLPEQTTGFALSTDQTRSQLPWPTGPRVPPSFGEGSVFSVGVPDAKLDQEQCLEISDTLDAPQHLMTRRQSSPDSADGPIASTTNLGQHKVADEAVETLERLLRSVFAAVGQALEQKSGFERIVALTPDQEVIMTAATQQAVDDTVHNVIGLCCLQRVPLASLLRIMKLSEASMKHADALEVRPDKSWDQTTVVSWVQRLSDIQTALRAARTCTRILSGGRNDKQLYSESVINRCVGILQTVTEDVVVPLVQLRNSGPSADLFKVVRRNRDAIAPVFACCRELIAVLAELVTKIELLDSVTNTLEFAAAKLTFVDNAHLERDSAIGVKLFDGIRFAAIDMLCQIFINKPDQRQGMLDDILHSHGKLPVGKGSKQFNLSCGASIQPVSALIMRLVQASAGRVPIDGGSRAAFVCGMGSDENMEYDELYTAEKGPAVATVLAEKRGAQQHVTAIQDLEAVTAPHAACVGRTASYIIDFMAKRTVGTTKTGDTPYRSLLDLFVEDLITCLGSPDWPSAELLLQLLMVTMVQLIEAPKTAAPARNLALELLGTMSAAISRLRSHVKDTASAFEGSEAGGLCQYLSGLATHVLAHECPTQQIVAWSGPLRATLEYLQGQCSKDPPLSSAISFIIADWASKIRSAFDSVSEADREQHHELGRLAYRLRLMIDDKKGSRSENTFKTVTTHQARFAFSILMLRSPLCQSFNKIFHVLLGSIASEQATVRSKSLKCVEHVLEIDHSILEGESAVVQLILDCSSDSSTQVRDSALILLGKCIEMRPSLEPRLIPNIVGRLQDAGVVVRKRAMKLACDIYLRNQNMGLRSAIANGLLRRIQDPDEGVRELARQVIERVWFAPFYASKNTTAVEAALMDHVALVVQTVKTATVTEALGRVLRIITKPSNTPLGGPFTVCSRLVDIMFGHIGNPESGDTSVPSCRDALQVLAIFAKADPKLFTLEQIRLLRPILASFTGRDEVAAFRAATVICQRVLPQLPTVPSRFLADVRRQLLKAMAKIPSRGALDDLIDCARTVCELLKDSSPLANLVASSLLRIQELCGALLDSKRRNQFCAYAIIAGSIARSCDLDGQLHIFREKFPRWQLASVPRLIVDTLLPFALPSQSMEARQGAIEAIGLVCQSWPRNYVLAEVRTAFQQVFQDRNSVLETMILRSFKRFLIVEEQRSEAGDTAPAARGDEEQLTVMGGTGVDDVAGAITQSFLSEITRIALGSQSEHAFLALEVLGSIRRQGLTHPKDIGITLITLETSTSRKIAEFAFMEHRSLHEKHETVLEREYVKAVQSAYNYQRDVVKDPRGATVGPFQSKLHLLMEVLKTSKLKNRQRFLEKLCSQTGFELSEVDATMGLPPHVGFARFILENVALFEYQTIGEIQTVVDTLEKIVTDTGTAVAQAIESEIFNVRVDVDEERPPQHPIAAEPVAAASADDYPTAGPRPVAESAGFALPVEPRRLRQLTTASMVLLSLWEACIYLRKLYNVSTDRHGTTAKVPAKELSKQLNKPPSMIQGVHEDKFWDAVASHMRGLQSGETMMKTCRLLVEVMSVGRDLEGAHGDRGPDALSWERNETRSERSRKRKASATPRMHKKRAQTSSRPRKRKRKHIAESSEDESDGDWM